MLRKISEIHNADLSENVENFWKMLKMSEIVGQFRKISDNIGNRRKLSENVGKCLKTSAFSLTA